MRVSVFTDWFYEFTAPSEVISVALSCAAKAQHYAGTTNWTSYPEEFFGDEIDLVQSWIDSCLEEVHLDLKMECDSLTSTVLWSTLSAKGQWHHCHKHDTSFASGVLYLNESSAETWFSRRSVWGPEHCMFAIQDPDTTTLFHKRKTEVGTLVVFPSGVYHSVTEHDRDEPRRTLSFNSFPSGQIGSFSETHSRRMLHLTVNQKQ